MHATGIEPVFPGGEPGVLTAGRRVRTFLGLGALGFHRSPFRISSSACFPAAVQHSLKSAAAALSWPIVSEPRALTVQVLIVDPDPVGRSACRKLIASRGLSVAEAASRELAMRWLETVGPQLLVLDYGLGSQLLKQVVTLYPKLEVVALCPAGLRARVSDEVRGMGLGAYVKDIWGKPLDPQRVGAVLASVFPGVTREARP